MGKEQKANQDVLAADDRVCDSREASVEVLLEGVGVSRSRQGEVPPREGSRATGIRSDMTTFDSDLLVQICFSAVPLI